MEYWKMCIEEALCEAGLVATEEQIKTITDWVDGAHENFSTATGSEHIPNPANYEIEKLKGKIKKLEHDHERQLNGIAKGVAHRRNVNVTDVSIDVDGHVTYR